MAFPPAPLPQLDASSYPKVALWQGVNPARIDTAQGSDGNGTTGAGLYANSFNLVYNGATFDRLRTPNVFKTAVASAAGNSAVWTPASGKRFRLMAYVVYVTENATLAVAGVEEITFQDAAAAIGLGFSDYVPAAAVAGTVPASSGWIVLGNGFLSAAANNVLNVNLGTALATGEVRVTVAGTEE